MPQKWWVLASVACGTFMATLDASIVNIALRTLTQELGADLSQVKWVVIAYLLTITCLLLPFGRLSDLHGRKKIFQLGFVVFTIGSLLCGISASLSVLLVSRVLQGVGASMLMANGPAIVTATFPASERGKALGTMAMVVSAGLVSGPSIGGLLITTMGWRSIFLVNIPVGILGTALVHKFLPADPEPSGGRSFDWPGAFLQMIVLISFMVLVEPPSVSISGSSPFPMSRLVIGGILVTFTALFLKIESESRAPILDLQLLTNHRFWSANLAGFFTFVAYSSVSVLVPYFLEDVRHFAPDRAGLFMTAVPLTVLFVAPVSGRLSDRFGSRGLSVTGALIGAVGLFLMAGALGAGIHEDVTPLGVVLGLCSIGLATGLFQSPNNNAIMSAVPHTKLGVASAMLATVRNLGLAVGTGLSTGLFAWRRESTGDVVGALHFTFYVAGTIAFAAVLTSLARHPSDESAETGK